MKICAIICEYNPFHNGHQYLIEQAKQQTNCDAILCLMSGNFVQRGEAAILNKFERAKHAVLCGADAVLELPCVFATSNAEIFARGAIALLSKIPEVTHLCFGTEHDEKEAFIFAANCLMREPQEISEHVKQLLDAGIGYAQAIATAREKIVNVSLFSSPNNILGIEYTKAILQSGASMEIVPIKRQGNDYHDETLAVEYSSATAIRKAIFTQTTAYIKTNIPGHVLQSLPNCKTINLDPYEKLAILQKSPDEIAKVLDCTEGLENGFIKAAQKTEPLVTALTSPRYTSARIRRIALQNLLGIHEKFIRECLEQPLYLTPLSYKKERTDLLSALSRATIPFLSSGKALRQLSPTAAACKQIDEYSETLYSLFSQTEISNKAILL